MATAAVMYGGPLDGTRTRAGHSMVSFVHPIETMIDGSPKVLGDVVHYLATDSFDRQGCRVYRYEQLKPVSTG